MGTKFGVKDVGVALFLCYLGIKNEIMIQERVRKVGVANALNDLAKVALVTRVV